ncbi:MAG: alpha/beta hydrolase [Aeromonadales bacterium]|nr:alpha/beta hydrolase [Aeromonadales bacterium]MDY2891767.1 alpha/beta hydrolase [Succinivibrio sp.]
MPYIPPRLLTAREFVQKKQDIESFYSRSVRIQRIKAPDGVTITACEYRPGHCERTLAIIPGRGETEHKYAEFLYSMQGTMTRVCVLFARGQGLSDRLLRDPQKCHIRSIKSLSSDIRLLIEKLEIKDFGLMAFSMGGLVALDFISKAENPPARCALIAPYIWPCVKLSQAAMECVAAIGCLPFVRALYTPYGAAYRRIPFDENYHSHCKERYEAYHDYYAAHPETLTGSPTFGFVSAATFRQLSLMASRRQLRSKVLFMPAGLDRVVSTPATVDFYTRHRGDALSPSLEVIGGAFHDVINESDGIRNPALLRALGYIFGA